MPCYSPVAIRNVRKSHVELQLDSFYRLVPCGKCLGCLRARQMQYAFRMEWEALDPRNVDIKFCTFTYAPEYLPPGNELSKLEVQHLVRRIKKNAGIDGLRLKYFFCGEHGSPVFTERAHYHCILFSSHYLPDRVIVRSWPFGIVDIAEANTRRFGYVAKYSVKQLGDGSEKWIQPPFMLCSNGLGFYFLEVNGDFCRKNYINTWLNSSGYQVSLPRVFMERLFPPRDKVHGLRALESDAAFVYYSKMVGSNKVLSLRKKCAYDARISVESVKRGLSVSSYEGRVSLGNSFIYSNKLAGVFSRVAYETGRY